MRFLALQYQYSWCSAIVAKLRCDSAGCHGNADAKPNGHQVAHRNISAKATGLHNMKSGLGCFTDSLVRSISAKTTSY